MRTYNKEQETREIEISSTISPGEIVIGMLVNIDQQGRALVDFQQNPKNCPLIAVSTLSISKQQKGRQVALLFENGDQEKPVIMGLIHDPLQDLIENFEVAPVVRADIELWPQENSNKIQKQVNTEHQTTIDGKKIVLEGKEEIVLKCGDASITLTKAGKILIRGKYLSNRSSGVNRIIGGSVQIN